MAEPIVDLKDTLLGQRRPVVEDPQALAHAQEARLEELSRDFERLQKQKARMPAGVESRILAAQAFSWGEQYLNASIAGLALEPHDANKLYLVFNLIGQRKTRLIGRLFQSSLTFGAQPTKKDPLALDNAEIVDRVILALDRIVDQPARTWELLDWLLTGGVAFEHICWIPNATSTAIPQFDEQNQLLFKDTVSGQVVPQSARDQAIQSGLPQERYEIYEEVELTGEVGDEILSPLCVFLDQSVKSIESLAPDQRVYVAKIRTQGWIEDTYADHANLTDLDYDPDLKIVTTGIQSIGESVASLFLKDMIPTVQGHIEEDDPNMAVVVDAYQPASRLYPRGRYTAFIPRKIILFDGPNPYPEIPLVDYHFTPVTTTFWTKDYVTDLVAPQRFLNKRMSQMGEQSNASIYDKLLLGPGLTAADIPTDQPGVVKEGLTEAGVAKVLRMPGPAIPGWFLESVKLAISLLNDVGGGGDLTESTRFPGQLRGPMAVPMLQEIIDSEWGPLYHHLAQRMGRVKQMRLNRVKQYYPPLRTMHFTNRDQRDEVMEFHADQVLQRGVDYNVSVEPSSIIPELRALREARIMERLNSPLSILYQDERTGHLDKSKIAMDLRMGDYGRVDRESASRKFAQQLMVKLRQGQQIPPVMPFYDHAPMMDELEEEMSTTEFLSYSPQIQQLFKARWDEHLKFIQQHQQAQQSAMESRAVQSAVAQATQQAAAKAAATAVDEALGQVRAQQQTQPSPMELVQAQTAQRQGPAAPPQRPPLPFRPPGTGPFGS